MTTIRRGDIDETAVTLGLLVGLLNEKDADEVIIQSDWFQNPLGTLRNITSSGWGRLFDLIGQVFEKDEAGNKDGKAEGEEWYAITYPDDQGASKKTPLFLVRKVDTGAAPKDVIGLGFKADFGSSVVVRPYFFLPVANKSEFVVGQRDYPIEAGIEISKSGGSDKIGTKAISFSGLRFFVKIHFDRAPEISDIVLFGLELDKSVTLPGLKPGQSEIGLIELFGNAPNQLAAWIEFVFELILAEISGEDGLLGSLGAVLNNLRLLLGLSKDKVPSIDWGKLTSNPDQASKKWLAQIFFNDACRKTWLNALQCLLNGAEYADVIRGNGTVANPYAVSVLSSSAGPSFAITFATDGLDRAKKLSLGLRLESGAYQLAYGIGVQFMAAVDAGPFLISQDDIKVDTVLPAFDLTVRICNPETTAQNPLPFFNYIPPSQLPPPRETESKAVAPATRLSIGGLQAGMRISFVDSLQFPAPPVPSLLFTDVTLGDESPYDVDLLALKKGQKDGTWGKYDPSMLLKVMGGALQDAYDGYQPSPYAYLSTITEETSPSHEDESDRPDIPALFEKLGQWLANQDPAKLPEQALEWLVGEGNIFGLLGELLSLANPAFSGSGQLLSYAPCPWPAFSVALGREPEDGFGMWMRPRAKLDAVSLSGEVAVIFKDGFEHPPAVTAEARVGLGDVPVESLKKVGFEIQPELAVTLGSNATSLSVDFYPLGSTADDAFVMVLLPSPLAPPYLAYKDKPTQAVAASDWFLRFVPRVLLPVFEEKLLNDCSVKELLEKSPLGPDSEFTAAAILMVWGALYQDEDQKYRVELDALSKLTAIGLLKSVVTTFRDSAADFKLLPIGSNGDGIYFVSEKGGGGDSAYTDFGLRLQITDIGFAGKKDASEKNGGKAKGSPKAAAKLQLGKGMDKPAQDKSLTNWIASSSNTLAGIDPGLTLCLLRLDKDNTATFKPGLELISVGLDIEGAAGQPLFNKNGYQLGGLQSRLYFSWKDGEDPNFGVAASLDGIGIPLGGTFDKGEGKGNPVAQNLLSSGDTSESDKGGNAAAGKSDAVNPTFSIEAAYINKDKQGNPNYFIELHGGEGSQADRVWFPIERQIGPLSCQKVGVAVDTSAKDNPLLTVIFDGGVKVASLEVDLIDLLVGIPLAHLGSIEDYQLDLEGMSLSFDNGAVEISGGFLKNREITPTHPSVTYDGDAILKFKQYSLSAFGSYGVLDGQASLFIFAMLTGPIGGPGFFYVTGIAAGFGYNRGLKVPGEAKEVFKFPLVALLPDPQQAIAPSTTKPNTGEVLQKLSEYIPPQRGEYWLAAGVQFTSFEIITGNLLLIVKFGNELEIDVLGTAKVKQPLAGRTYVYAELGLVATFNPAHGLLMVKAALTDNSYVIDPGCHLTGGFAFATWFDPNEHAGDFVLTIGGYHPGYIPAPHYPKVDPLGFNWQYSDEITISGEAYFALTPSVAMLGGRLDLEFYSGNLRAWAIAHADMIIFWMPFYLDASVGITIGVSYRIDALFVHTTLEVSLGVELEVYGPPTGGKAHVDWYVISFTIGFGESKTIDTAPTMGWESFQTMLPQTQKAQATRSHLMDVARPTLADAPPPSSGHEVAVLSINAGAGVQATEEDRWLIRFHSFSFTVQTSLPVNSVSLTGAEPIKANSTVAIRPMGIAQLDSAVDIAITKAGTPVSATWNGAALERKLPPAMWGPPIAREFLPKTPEEPLECLVGLDQIHLNLSTTAKGTDEFDAKNVFDYFRLETVTYNANNAKGKAYYRQFLGLDPSIVEPTKESATPGSLKTVSDTINDAKVSDTRQRLFAALAVLGTHAGSNGSLQHLAENPIGDLLGVPMQIAA